MARCVDDSKRCFQLLIASWTGSRGDRAHRRGRQRLAELYRQPVGYFTGEDEASASLPADVALLARQAAKLSVKDREELGRFAEFLKARATSGEQ